MGGALKSVFGGSGGIFGAVLGVASMFFPPLAVAGSLSNLLTSAIGEAVKMAASTLVKEFAMPKFLEGVVGQVVDKALSSLQQHESSPELDAFTKDKFGPAVEDYASKLVKTVVETTRKNVEKEQKKSADGKVSASSWLTAIAQAMGEVLGDKAARMVELSEHMGDLNNDAKTISNDPKDNKAREAREENARDMTKTQMDLQGVSQEFSILQNSFSNALKTIGEGLSQAGRKG